ncbi:MAG: Gfo/Idh/MocA family oxidoreductase [Planctomycetia bacterium]|nr:Gfo/Idh/MocA family oxidoreductase [Planctomycetia bacterium]
MIPTSFLTRRDFLRSAAAAAVAVPTIVPRWVLGGDQPGPGEKVTVGMIGLGMQADGFHVPSLLGLDDVRVLAVCDVDTNRRRHAKQRIDERYGAAAGSKGCDEYNDFRDVLARKDIDAVLIAAPDHWHAIASIEACKAGKDVYCEKPLTLAIHEGPAMIEAVRKCGRVFQTGSQLRSGQEYAHYPLACELIRSGRIGKVRRVFVSIGEPSKWCDLPEEPVEPGLDWNLWLGQAPLRPYNSILSPRGMPKSWPMWRAYREYSGGSYTDIGAHEYDIVQWALDMDGSGPIEIIPPDDPKAMTGVKYVYANGVELIHGGPGGIVFEGTDGKITLTRPGMKCEPESIAKEPLGEKDVHLFKSPGHHRNWIDCIRSRQRPVCDVEIGARSITVAHLGNLAYWNRRKLKWDPANWRFVDDAEANTWLDRPRRDPWQLPTV